MAPTLVRAVDDARARQSRNAAHASGSRPKASASHGEPAPFSALGNLQVQRERRVGRSGAGSGAVGDVARSGIAGTSGRLPYFDTVQRSFGPRFNLSGARAHQGGAAAAASAELGANAYTIGDDVVFRASPSLRTVAHEAAHVVQQRSGIALPGGLDQPGDAFERDADDVAERVVQGNSAADLLPPPAAHRGQTQIQRQSDAGVPTAAPPPPSPYYTPGPDEVANRVREEMARPSSVAGIGDFHAAYVLLCGQLMQDLLATLADLKKTGDLELLAANFGSAARFDPMDQARLQVAMTAVMTAGGGTSGQFPGSIDGLPAAIHALPPDQIDALMNFIVGVTGARTQEDIERLALEGQQVISRESEDTNRPSAGAPTPTVGAVYGPGRWGPGQTPIGFYIGNSAHIGIASYYTLSHLGEVVYTNFISIDSILSQLDESAITGTPSRRRPSAARLEGKPDIANMTLHHLYEIKPAGSEAEALAEAEWYQRTFEMSGIPMSLGPSSDPGVNGFFYDIGWYFVFDSPEPGVITYERQKRSPAPVLVPVPEPSKVPSEAPERGIHFSMPKLSREQMQTMVATVTVAVGLAMLAYMALAILAL
jgi:hypothetical protein